ncbi:MAG: hypothetical protein H7A45_12555 [Verrucomicrobiales bacterium]|nr:hypothetical protein [Verrucomicrobiales bacterium]
MRQRCITPVGFVQALLAASLPLSGAGAGMPPDTLWLVGRPDARTQEFGLTDEGYAQFDRVFPGPVRFTVGRSAIKDWPFVHPAPRDSWAGGREHTFTLRFSRDAPAGPACWLVLGLAGAHRSERSEVQVRINDLDLPPQLAPAGSMHLVFQPDGVGDPSSLVFALPPEALRHGDNEIAITLRHQSWILYDYLALRTVPEPLPIATPRVKETLLAGPLHDVREVVFAARKIGSDGHWYANIGYYSDWEFAPPGQAVHLDGDKRVTYLPGGRLGVLDVATGGVRWLIDDPDGGVRDPVVHYDGRTVLFGYRRGGSEHYHLHTIQADGTGLRQLTDGDYDDFEPCWLPDGDIVFVSTRAKRWVNCWITQVATLHRCDAQGGNIRAISANIEHDNTPWVLPDGRILYQRWEYVDRSQVDYHHLWTANPDGTGQMVYYGNQHPGVVMIDAKPVPGSSKVVAIFSPGHGQREHAGAVAILDAERGPDEPSAARYVTRATDFRDPWAFSEDAFMAARDGEIVLLNGSGSVAALYRLPEADRQAGLTLHEPRPLIPRRWERVIPPAVDPAEATGRVILANVYEGRNMTGVQPGDIRKLLVLETLPKPVNFTGGMDPLTYGGSFTLERVLGTIPVEPDGSAYAELPALRGLFFVALDKDDLAVKRMQSFLTVQPGEVVSCVGCHEQRTRTYLAPQSLAALRRPPSRPEPIADCPDVFDFPRDIQPILDRLCVDCHDYTPGPAGGPYAGGVVLSGDHGPMFSHSYFTLTVNRLFRDGRNEPKSNHEPRELGSAASRILTLLDGSHYGATATDHERRMMRLWIEVGAPYPGTYGALGCGSIGGYSENNQVHTDFDWPTTRAGAGVIARRCASCHTGERALPASLSDEIGLSFWRFSLDDPRLQFSRHIVFNLSRPEQSLLLLAPLAPEAGGYGVCRSGTESDAVFAGRDDPDYRRLREMVRAGRDYLAEIKRFDMPGFRPREAYVREMRRYGVLTVGEPDSITNPYHLDQAYWRSLWWKP